MRRNALDVLRRQGQAYQATVLASLRCHPLVVNPGLAGGCSCASPAAMGGAPWSPRTIPGINLILLRMDSIRVTLPTATGPPRWRRASGNCRRAQPAQIARADRTAGRRHSNQVFRQRRDLARQPRNPATACAAQAAVAAGCRGRRRKGPKNRNSVSVGLPLRAATRGQVPLPGYIFSPASTPRPCGWSLAYRRLPRACQPDKDASAVLISSSVLPVACSRPV